MPVLGSVGSASSTFPTESRDTGAASHSAAKTPPTAERGAGKDRQPQEALGVWLAQWYPLFKTLHVQVSVGALVGFLPAEHVVLEKDEATMSIPANVCAAWGRGQLPPTMVLCCPAVTVTSAGGGGRMAAGAETGGSAVTEIPIHTGGAYSIAGEKLPWTVELSRASLYTLHHARVSRDVVRPVSIATSLAVTAKYSPPASDNVAALALVLHGDMDTVDVHVDKGQVELVCGLLRTAVGAGRDVVTSVLVFRELHAVAQQAAGTVTAAATRASNASQHQDPVSPGLVDMSTQDVLTETTTTDRTGVAVGVGDDPPAPQVKLSTWLQWTLAKVSITLYGHNLNTKQHIRVISEAEDLTTSVDLQDVYSKVVCKVGSVSSSHSVRKGTKWLCGPYDGVLLCCASLTPLSPGAGLPSSTPGGAAAGGRWPPSSCSDPALPTSGGPGEQLAGEVGGGPTQQAGFLHVTFTRALRKNARRKMRKLCGESEAPRCRDDDRGAVHLNEVCVSVSPCDVVLNCPVLVSLLHILTATDLSTPGNEPVATNTTSLHQQQQEQQPDQEPVARQSASDDATSMPLLNSVSLPLVYLSARNLRVFLPNCDATTAMPTTTDGDGDEGSSKKKGYIVVKSAPDAVSDTSSSQNQEYIMVKGADVELQTETVSDAGSSFAAARKDGVGNVLVFQMAALELAPNADNPLPRVVLDKDVFRRALAAGITTNHGAEVEDRQYQLDVAGLALSTGEWRELVTERGGGGARRGSSSQQNPALEWNNLSHTAAANSANVDDEASKLTPLASAFDLRAVAAPPVVYMPHDHNEKSVLVCGPSLEMNATSDMDFYLSLSQVHLLTDIYTSNVSPVIEVLAALPKRSPTKPQQEATPVESSSNRMQCGSSSSCHKKQPRSKTPQRPSTAAAVIPFDMLLTAGKISFMVYKTVTVTGPVVDPPTTSEEEIATALKTRSQRRVAPIAYAYFSQPHSLVKCLHDSQKIELSCYDIVFKGAKAGHIVADESKFIPESSDFSEHWIETRPGRPDPKTGIPPSLYTMQLTDFLTENAQPQASLRIERPIRVSFDSERISQIEALVDELGIRKGKTDTVEKHDTKDTAKDKPKESGKAEPAVAPPGGLLGVLLRRRGTGCWMLHVSTVQVVAAVEVTHGNAATAAGVMLSLAEFSNNMTLTAQPKTGAVEEAHNELYVRQVQLKTQYCGGWRRMLGPVTVGATVTAQWGASAGAMPRLLVFIDTGALLGHLGQEHFLCFKVIMNQVEEWIQKYGGSLATSASSPPGTKKTLPRKRRSDVPSEREDETTDDLRAGDFVFVTGEGDHRGGLLPAARHVYFGLDYETGRATLTWTYAEPRVLTTVSATPVPFSLPLVTDEGTRGALVNEAMKVPCIVQRWDSLRQRFEDHAEFSLSEHVTTEAALPGSGGPDEVAAQTWRVLILHPRDQGDLCDLHYQLDDIVEPVVSPLTLAASLKVNSCFLRHLVPNLQLSFTMATAKLHLSNHLKHLGSRTPRRLRPFTLGEECGPPSDQLVGAVNLDTVTLRLVSWGQAPAATVSAQVSGSARLSVVEYRSLTQQPLLSEPLTVSASVSWAPPAAAAGATTGGLLKADVAAQQASLVVGPSTLHTVSATADAWSQVLSSAATERERPLLHHYVLCNNTRENMRAGQVATEEALALAPRQALPYAWRSHRSQQSLHVCVESLGWQWSEAISLDRLGTADYMIERDGVRATVIVTVKRLSNVQKQVVLSGQLVFASRVCEAFDVRLLTTRPAKEPLATLPAAGSCPAYVIETSQVRAFKLRLHGQQRTLWSQEVSVDPKQAPRLVKVQLLSDSTRHLHVWCHVFTQNLGQSQQYVVLLTPVFVLENRLPSHLLVNITTPATGAAATARRVGLEGRGARHQLGPAMPADTTHNLTFQLGPDMKVSNPAITVSSGMIEQLPFEALKDVDIDKLSLEWAEEPPKYPYDNTSEPANCPEHLMQEEQQEQQPQSISEKRNLKSSDTMKVSKSADSKAADSVSHSNIDLQVRLSQCWPGCHSLLISVAPNLVMTNALRHLDLVLLLTPPGDGAGTTEDGAGVAAETERCLLPRRATTAPPPIQGAFRLGVEHAGDLHVSPPLRLSPEDHNSRYLPSVDGLLYVEAHIPVTIPIMAGGTVTKLVYLTLHSTLQDNMRVLTVRERFSISNQTALDLTLSCHTVPLTAAAADTAAKVSLTHATVQTVLAGDRDGCHPLLVWTVSTSSSPDNDPTATSAPSPPPPATQHVQYIAFSQQTEEESVQGGRPLTSSVSDVSLPADPAWGMTATSPQELSSPPLPPSSPVAFTFPAGEAAVTLESSQRQGGHRRQQSLRHYGCQVSMAREAGGETGPGRRTLFQWSCPLRVKVPASGDSATATGCRQNVAVPRWHDDNKDVWSATTSLTVTTHSDGGVTYLVVTRQQQPAYVVTNNCHFGLHMGQTLLEAVKQAGGVYEEAELVSGLPLLPPHSAAAYNFPTVNTRFPDIYPPPPDKPRLHFAGCPSLTRAYAAAVLERLLSQGWQPAPGGEGPSLPDAGAISGALEGGDGGCHAGLLRWSHGIDLASQYDVFVTVPGVSDIKVHMEKVGFTTYVFVDPMNRAEISAKEIRSRIKGKEPTTLKETAKAAAESAAAALQRELASAMEEAELTDPLLEPGLLRRLLPAAAAARQPPTPRADTDLTVTCATASVVLVDEVSGLSPRVVSEVTVAGQRRVLTAGPHGVVRELLRVTADDMALWCSPRHGPADANLHPRAWTGVLLMVGDLQIDNQLYGESSNYDFPVLLIGQSRNKMFSHRNLQEMSRLPFTERVLRAKQNGMLVVAMDRCCDLATGRANTVNLTVATQPVSAFVEDLYIRDLMAQLDTFLPGSGACRDGGSVASSRDGSKQQRGDGQLPRQVMLAATMLNCPIRLDSVKIEPVKMLLSVHASLKLFLASDNTPLSFSVFEREQMFTNTQQLTKAVVLHYASGALFRAGIVVGSLELLGNPTGLVRSVGAGVSELFRLPYEGAGTGPTGFLAGVGRGVGSLLMHVSTGTLTSITSFASSVSRNMDRLSLDAEHSERQEAGRRRGQPHGLTQGLYNGLTGLGLSLLGAVAGLADQPLQAVTGGDQSSNGGGSRGIGASAAGLVTGVGKGLVGAVTKPLGGAAEFVSQTGLGLLHGAGLSSIPKHRHKPEVRTRKDFANSELKYLQKYLQTLPNNEILLSVAVEAITEHNPHSDSSQLALEVSRLVLVAEALIVVSDGADEQLQALAVTEVTVRAGSVDDDRAGARLEIVMWDTPATQQQHNSWHEDRMSHKDRVKAFVQTTSLTSVPLSPSAATAAMRGLAPPLPGPGSDDHVHGGAGLPNSQRRGRQGSVDCGSGGGVLQYAFLVASPAERDLFVDVFILAKQRALGAGFNV